MEVAMRYFILFLLSPRTNTNALSGITQQDSTETG